MSMMSQIESDLQWIKANHIDPEAREMADWFLRGELPIEWVKTFIPKAHPEKGAYLEIANV